MNDNGMTFTIGENGEMEEYKEPYTSIECPTEEEFDRLSMLLELGKNAEKLNTLEDWREEDGDCLWWRFPIEEPPYCGGPLDCKFPNDVTHFTIIAIPKEPK